MSFETSNTGKAENFNGMGFSALERHSVAGPILQEQALKYLKTEDSKYFEREFSGELDADGYLLRKDGTSSNTTPSQNIGGGKAMERVLAMTREALKA